MNQKGAQLDQPFSWKIRPTLGQNISGTKYDRDKPIDSAEKVYNRDPIRSKSSKTCPPPPQACKLRGLVQTWTYEHDHLFSI